MTTAQLYRKHKAGEIGRDRFIYEVRRDSNLPWITNTTSYDDAVKILKNKGIISEMDQNVQTDPAVDRVNPYFLKRGVNKLLSKEEELTNDSYINALNKAAKALEKNPHAYDDEMFANNEDVKKHDEKLEMEDVKKGNLNDKKNEMKKVKVKKASLKEDALKELTDSLKKKDAINEDVHYKHTVGSEVHTPDGPGVVKEIVGGTLTVELEDGQLKDYQINTIDHHSEKAQEEAQMHFKDEPADSKYNIQKDTSGKIVQATNSDGVKFSMNDQAVTKDTGEKIKIAGFEETQGKVMAKYNTGMFFTSVDIDGLTKQKDMKVTSPFGGSTVTEKVKEYMDKHKDDKDKMGKLKEIMKKIKEVKALVVPKTATGPQIDKIAQSDPTIKPGQQIDIIRK